MKFKVFFSSFAVMFGVITSCAQQTEDKSKRASPPAKVEQTVSDADIVIDYSQPSVKGRDIYGDLVPYGEVWRTGANEATTFETDKDLEIQGKTLPAGKYALFTIPGEDEWTIIFNEEHEQWGAYDYDASKDVLRVTAEPMDAAEPMEKLKIIITEDGIITIGWADKQVPFVVKA